MVTKRTIPQSQWKWFGAAGHLIVASWCRFHLCTQVGNYLVSTVGAYVHPRHGQGKEIPESKWLKDNWPGEDIGYGRKYETMVFKVGDSVCVSKECNCGMPEIIDYGELDMDGYNTAGDATKGHNAMCLKYSGITNGEEHTTFNPKAERSNP